MPYDLANLRLSEMTQLGTALRTIGKGAHSMEEAAERVVSVLYNDLLDATLQTKACALVRFYLTTDYANLDDDLRAVGTKLMQGYELAPATRCLTLMATIGDKQEWKSRKASTGHQTIPLPSADTVHAIPMVSQLIARICCKWRWDINASPVNAGERYAAMPKRV